MPHTSRILRLEGAVEGAQDFEARDVLEELADQAAQLPTTDAKAFRAAAQQITSRMDDVSAPFEEAMNKASRLDRSKKLDKSLRKLRACKPLL